MDKEKKWLVPKLRFPQFTDAWERRKLGDVAEIVGGGTPDTKNAAYWNGEIDWYSPSEIGETVYVSNSQKKITEQGLQKSSAKILPAHKTILFTSRASIGDMAILLKSGTTNQGFQSLIVNDNHNDVYFLYSMGIQIKAFALKNASGSTFLEISKKQLSKIELWFPDKQEQTAIGNFFKQIDQLITLHQRKLENVKTLKKGLLQKMFPQNGQTVPEVRFPQFTDAWEQCKLGDVGKTISGVGFPEHEQGGKLGIPFYKVSDMNLRGNELVMQTANHFVTEEQIKINNWKVIKNTPAIVFAKVGAALLLNRKRLVLNDFLIDNNTMAYALSNSWDLYFAKTIFETICLPKFAQTGALPSFNGKDIEKIVIKIPSNLAEQTAIGNFFKQIDQLITLHQRKLDNLKQLKKSLLQQMFV